jgi:hypothetical protein
MYSYQLIVRAKCSDADKATLIPLVEQMIEFSCIARRDGIFPFEPYTKTIENKFQHKFWELLYGTDIEVINEVGQVTLALSNYEGKELLANMITLTTIVSIGRGEIPDYLFLKLESLFGGYELPVSVDEIDQKVADRIEQECRNSLPSKFKRDSDGIESEQT